MECHHESKPLHSIQEVIVHPVEGVTPDKVAIDLEQIMASNIHNDPAGFNP